MDQKNIIAILGIIIVVLMGTTVYISTTNNTNRPIAPNPKKTMQQTSKNVQPAEEMVAYPKEYTTYQDYLQAIGEGFSATPKYFDTGVIEATVISLTNSDVCPSTTGETCNIEPYPNDYATVRIDRIVSYSPYAEQTASQPVEQPNRTLSEDSGSTTPGNMGVDYPQQKVPEIARLQEGQNASTHFILTARPVKVRYVSVEPENGGLESQQTASRNSDLTQTVTHTTEPGKKIFEPILKESGYFVFTTKIVPYPETSQKILSGLKVGDKFRANIKYDGATIVVGEYEIIPSKTIDNQSCQSYGQGVGGGDSCGEGYKCDGSGPDGTSGKCVKK